MSEQSKIVKEGFLKKRKAKLHQWSQRYFVLTDRTLSYKIKSEAHEFKDSYDLVPGCIVTQIETETRASLKGRRLFSFWVVWPHDKSKLKDDEHHSKNVDSDDEKEATNAKEEEGNRVKNLKSIVESEVWEHRKQKNIVEEQIEMHHQRDNNISLGAKVAAVTVGGVIVGALTAGIGLLPYIAVVGVATVAGGGAVVYNWRKPFDSRLIIACDTMEEAVEWRTAIEAQISKLESASRRLNLPSSLDPRVIGVILNRAQQQRLWRRVSAPEGMRILELLFPRPYSELERRKRRLALLKQTNFEHRTVPSLFTADCDQLVKDSLDNLLDMKDISEARCRRAQISVPTTPIQTFLLLMSETCGMLGKNIGFTARTLQQIDDHADALEVEIDFGLILGRKPREHMRKLYFSRFWSLDDDGVYLITLCASNQPLTLPNQSSSVSQATVEYHPVKLDAKKRVYSRCSAPTAHAVITVSPRADFAEFPVDVHDCIVSCSVQLTNLKEGGWSEEEQSAFMNALLQAQLLELKDLLYQERFTPLHPNALFLTHSTVSGSDAAFTSLSAADGATHKYPPSPPPSSPPSLKRAATANTTEHQQQRSVSADQVPPIAAAVVAPPAPNNPTSGRSHRRGVTTVQPGMEDAVVTTANAVTSPAVTQHIGIAGSGIAAAVPVSAAIHSSPLPSTASAASHHWDDGGHVYPNSPATVASSNATAAANAEQHSKPSRTRRVLGLFSRSKTGNQVPSERDMHGQDRSVSPSTSQRQMTREERRQREKDFNTTAKKLRVKIEEKVCELKRVAETMRQASRQGMLLGDSGNSNVNSSTSSSANAAAIGGGSNSASAGSGNSFSSNRDPGSSSSNNNITPAQFALLQDQQGELYADLQRLKHEYQSFTGAAYDDKQATRHSRFGRWGRSKASSKPSGKLQASPSVSQIIDLSDDETLSGAMQSNLNSILANSGVNAAGTANLGLPMPERAVRQTSRTHPPAQSQQALQQFPNWPVKITRLPPSFWMQPVPIQQMSRAVSMTARWKRAMQQLSDLSFWMRAWQHLAQDLLRENSEESFSQNQRNIARLGPVADADGAVARDRKSVV